MRDHFDELGFVDVETPMLGRSTPEGAETISYPADSNTVLFCVTAITSTYKQLLMIAGFDRYVQVAKCFRDEDLRADRQPEFTQLDVEMSFVEAHDVTNVIESLVVKTAKDILDLDITLPVTAVHMERMHGTVWT